jgi:YVTN family beta-propeller protein
VIDTETNLVTESIFVGVGIVGLAFTPNGSKVYCAIGRSNTVEVIDTAKKSVTATIMNFGFPSAFGIFIQPAKP